LLPQLLRASPNTGEENQGIFWYAYTAIFYKIVLISTFLLHFANHLYSENPNLRNNFPPHPPLTKNRYLISDFGNKIGQSDNNHQTIVEWDKKGANRETIWQPDSDIKNIWQR